MIEFHVGTLVRIKNHIPSDIFTIVRKVSGNEHNRYLYYIQDRFGHESSTPFTATVFKPYPKYLTGMHVRIMPREYAAEDYYPQYSNVMTLLVGQTFRIINTGEYQCLNCKHPGDGFEYTLADEYGSIKWKFPSNALELI